MTSEPRMTEEEARALVAAHGLPPIAVRPLVTMFRDRPECRRSIEDIAHDGFARSGLRPLLSALAEAGLVQRERGAGKRSDIYRLLVGEAPR